MKKIAFLTTQYNEVKSGPGRFTEYLKSLPFENIRISFFSQQISVQTKNEFPVHIPGWAQKVPFSSFLRAWFFNRALREADKTELFDFILAADYSMAMFLHPGLLKKTAVMVNDDNFLLIYSKEENRGAIPVRTSLSRKLGYFLEKSVVEKAAFTIVNSKYTKQLIEKVYQVPPYKLKLLYKAVDVSWFAFVNRQVHAPKRFLFVKNDWKRGGLDMVLTAFAQLKFQETLVLRIAGISPSKQAEIRQLVVNSGFKGLVEIEGLVNREKLYQLMCSSDVFVKFSRQEALGVSCLEAMASGLPVLASDAGGLKEVLDNGNAGFMVKNSDVTDLIRTLERMHSNPESLKQMAEAARMHVLTFSAERLKENMDRLFD